MATTRLYLSPWRELDTLTQRHADFYAGDVRNGGSRPARGWNPRVSVEETPDALVLTAEVPGMSPEDVELHVENGVLTVRGEKRESAVEGEQRSYHVRERSYGSFTRSFTLPRSVRPDGISAGLENGLLRVRLAKAPEARSRRIEIGGKVPAAVAGEESTK